jgi:16S rRNA C967 or C1407 C5-methylase (RsmB/RsmF family)
MTNFDKYFGDIFGSRWAASLKPALLGETKKVYLQSPFDSGSFQALEEPLSGAYALDRASLEPVYALELEAGQTFLDLCSAPGGKALTAIYLVKGILQARLMDMSPARMARLRAVLFDHLPEGIAKAIQTTCNDGARVGQRFPASFDRVLADVPCSAERHHLLDGKLDDWKLSQTKRMSIRQHALACSAIDATVSGGRVVYSTCSLSPFENDGVIKKLEKSRSGAFKIVRSKLEMGEATEFGKLILPDLYPGFGPIYYSILEKL